MSDPPSEPSSQLKAARRELFTLQEFKLLDDFAWEATWKCWMLRCCLSTDVPPDSLVSAKTEWYVMIAPLYPRGEITFLPSSENSIKQTFPHQSYNQPTEFSWMTGKLCLSTSTRALKRHAFDNEPRSYDRRLRWHVQRTIRWLQLAAAGKLFEAGDLFELPDFSTSSDLTVAFSETSSFLNVWSKTQERAGLVDFIKISSGTFCTENFRLPSNEKVLENTWGVAIASPENPRVQGAWILLDQIPILEPWQAPMTWSELSSITQQQGLRLTDTLGTISKFLRDGSAHILLLGFPIPAIFDGEAKRIHWQPLLLPTLHSGRKPPPGFRNTEKSLRKYDQFHAFKPDKRLAWLSSENWHEDEIASRGRFPVSVREKKVAVIGGGALASVVSELLVRQGQYKPLVIDGDTFKAGNGVRHILDLDYVGKNKAEGLAHKLNKVSPHADVSFVPNYFSPASNYELQNYNLVLDLTGDDDVIEYLESYPWSSETVVISAATGLNARRLFCFSSLGTSFSASQFREEIFPYLDEERQIAAEIEFPREGVGCWHPVFPARADDIWLWAATVSKYVENVATDQTSMTGLTVFEQIFEDNIFLGFKRVKDG